MSRDFVRWGHERVQTLAERIFFDHFYNGKQGEMTEEIALTRACAEIGIDRSEYKRPPTPMRSMSARVL